MAEEKVAALSKWKNLEAKRRNIMEESNAVSLNNKLIILHYIFRKVCGDVLVISLVLTIKTPFRICGFLVYTNPSILMNSIVTTIAATITLTCKWKVNQTLLHPSCNVCVWYEWGITDTKIQTTTTQQYREQTSK